MTDLTAAFEAAYYPDDDDINGLSARLYELNKDCPGKVWWDADPLRELLDGTQGDDDGTGHGRHGPHPAAPVAPAQDGRASPAGLPPWPRADAPQVARPP